MELKQEQIISLFVTNEMTDRLLQLKPWANCDKCNHGYIEKHSLCSCTMPAVLEQILNAPPRFCVNFTMNGFNLDMLKHTFVVLKGSDFYVKLVAFHIGKLFVNGGKIVMYVVSQLTMTPEDHVALNQADVVLFNDLAGRIADANYKIELDKRMDANKQVIFLNTPYNANVIDNQSGKLMSDIFEINVDDFNIRVVSK